MARIEKRGEAYRITVSSGYDTSGKQLRKTKTWHPAPGMTAKQIEKALQREAVMFEEQVERGTYMDGNIKFQDFAERWFNDYAEKHLRPRTIDRYRQLSARTYQAIGHIRIDRLQPQHLNAFYAQLAQPGANAITGKPLAPKTIKHYHTFISSVMDRAVKWQLVQENPCRRVDAPKTTHREPEFLTPEEAVVFMQNLQDEPLEYQVIFSILLLTGMRRGEALGLEWQDFDFESGTVRICRTSQYSTGRGIFTDDTKTEQSKRLLSIPAELIDLLRRYRSEQAARRLKMGDQWDSDWQAHPRLFTQWNGKPMHPGAPYQELQKFLERHGMRKVSLHSLRHTNATLLINSGTDVRSVAGRLGHTQTSTTMNIYAHLLQSANKAASETLADLLIRNQA
ncbi:MAG: tyrosine-type recombinase/integrase [Acutalibacteraceae bacterium]